MLFILTDQDVVLAIQTAIRREDGLLEVHFPVANLRDNASSRPDLTFSDSSHTVHRGKLSARLSPTQYELLRYVYSHGRVSNEELQDSIWKAKTTDDAIRRVVSKINTKLMDSGFALELLSYRSRVSLEEVA